MAIRFATGYDGLQTADLTIGLFTTIVGGTQSVQATVARNSGRAHQFLNAGHASFTNVIGGAQASFVIGGAVRVTSLASARTFMGVGDGAIDVDASAQICLGLKTDGTLEVIRGRAIADDAGGTVLATSTNVTIAINTFYYIEFKGTIHDSTGSFEVRVNNVAVTWSAANTNVDTKNTANATYNVFAIGGIPSGGGSTYWDDVYMLDGSTDTLNDATDFLGDVSIRTRHTVDGNGTLAGSTPNSGTDRGNRVKDTTQDGDTSYNSFTVAGQQDSYNRTALGLTGTIKGIVERNLIRKSDAGAATARNLIRIGSTNYFGATESPGTGYGYISTHRTKSPVTSSAYSISEIDGAQTGLERVS